MKQTAVEFAVEQLEKLIPSGNQILIRRILIEAKEMEKQQIMEANTAGVNQGLYGYKNAEEYYNKTFKNK